MRFRVLFLVSLTFFGVRTVAQVHAVGFEGWFNGGEVAVTKKSSGRTIQKNTYYNAPCIDSNFDTLVINGWGVRNYSNKTECVHYSSYGHLNTSGLLLAGSNVSYAVKSTTGTTVNQYPIPSSEDAFSYGGAVGTGTTHPLYIYKSLPENIIAHTDGRSTKPLYYKLTKPHQTSENRVYKPDGTQLTVVATSINYSSNGEKIIADAGHYQVLVDVASKAARLFGEKTWPIGGVTPKTLTALNSNGGLAFVADNNSRQYRLYNLSNCVENANVSAAQTCQRVDLTAAIKGSISNLQLITNIRFISDSIIELYARSTVNGIKETNKYYIEAPDARLDIFEYLGMGDSYASGEGAYEYKPATDSRDNRCHVSTNSYPYLIKEKLSYNASESIACSGAMIKDTHDIHKRNYSKDYPQSNTLQDPAFDAQIYENFLPGHRRQIEFVSRNQPRVMTLSVGGNDINFGEKVQKCVLWPNTCYKSDEEKAVIAKELKSIFNNLVTTYSNILQSSADSKLYIIGYPLIAKPDSSCALNVRLNNQEIKFSEAIIKDLNTVIETATNKAGAYYVDVSDAFFGHRMCETDSWNVAVNGLTAGKGTPFEWGPIGGASYHPNKLGHELYKSKILEETIQFTAEMPEPSEEASLDTMQSELIAGVSGGEGIPLPVGSRITQSSVLEKGASLSGVIANTPAYILTDTEFRAELHSEPVAIGTATAIDLHNLQLQVQIPEDTEPGMHTIHLFGTNLAGEEIDLYQDVYVVSSTTDYDGDGITNEEDSCQFIEASSVDSDTDGSDDACDPFIAKAPAEDSPVVEDEVVGEDNKEETPKASTETTETDTNEKGGIVISRSINTLTTYRSQFAEVIASRNSIIGQSLNSGGSLLSTKIPHSDRKTPKNVPKSNKEHTTTTKKIRPTWKQFLFFFGVSAPIAVAVIYRARSLD